MNNEPETLKRSMLYRTAGDSLHRLLHLSGVPREFWNSKESDVAFDTYRAERSWRKEPDVFTFPSKDQLATFEGVLAAIRHEGSHPYEYLAGTSIVIASEQSATSATYVASLLVKTLIEYNSHATVRWYNANARDKWGRPIGIDFDLVPDLVVVTGLNPKCSVDAYETVDRLRDWALRFCPCVLVGSGKNPISLAVDHYNFRPNIALYTNRTQGKLKVLG